MSGCNDHTTLTFDVNSGFHHTQCAVCGPYREHIHQSLTSPTAPRASLGELQRVSVAAVHGNAGQPILGFQAPAPPAADPQLIAAQEALAATQA